MKSVPAAPHLFRSGHSDSSLSSIPSTPDDPGFDSEMLANMHINVPETSDTEMLGISANCWSQFWLSNGGIFLADLETQIPFTSAERSDKSAAEDSRPRNHNVKEASGTDEEVNCDCEIKVSSLSTLDPSQR